jgi:small subunit ribosomal protein S5
MTTPTTPTTNTRTSSAPRKPFGQNGARPPRRDGKSMADRVKDVDQKILDIRRVTRVVAGGRRMSFAVSMLIGDKNLGVVGVGTGKGNDTAVAIGKALKDAKKNAVKIKVTKTRSIPYSVSAKYCASRVTLFPNQGKGIVTGAAIRDIVVIAGLKDVSGKVVSGSKNKLNNARAVMKALAAISVPYYFNAPKAPEAVVPVEEVKA